MARQAFSEVADRVFDAGTKWASFFLVVEDGHAILIDAGYPRYSTRLQALLDQLGLEVGAIEAVFVTHHHADHAGVAEFVRTTGGATVYVGADDAHIARGEHPSHPPSGFWQQSWRPSMVAYLLHSALAGGAGYRPVGEVSVLSENRTFDLPGRPRVVQTPGHTAGHLSVVLEDRGVLCAGDAMVNFDYPTGARGLRLHRFNEDRDGAVASLDRLDGLDLETVLFGHGHPYKEGSKRAVEAVRAWVDRHA